MSIAYKEARETSYWLRLLRDSDYIGEDAFTSIHDDCEERLELLCPIAKTARQSG